MKVAIQLGSEMIASNTTYNAGYKDAYKSI